MGWTLYFYKNGTVSITMDRKTVAEHTDQRIENKRVQYQTYKQPRQVPFFGPELSEISEDAFFLFSNHFNNTHPQKTTFVFIGMRIVSHV
jgi:poly-D-alanine transfer protein DltD